MMLNRKAVNIYGFVAIGVMTAMLLLMLTRVIPRSMYVPLFCVALGLYLVRIVLRLMLAKQERERARSKEEGEGGG